VASHEHAVAITSPGEKHLTVPVSYIFRSGLPNSPSLDPRLDYVYTPEELTIGELGCLIVRVFVRMNPDEHHTKFNSHQKTMNHNIKDRREKLSKEMNVFTSINNGAGKGINEPLRRVKKHDLSNAGVVVDEIPTLKQKKERKPKVFVHTSDAQTTSTETNISLTIPDKGGAATKTPSTTASKLNISWSISDSHGSRPTETLLEGSRLPRHCGVDPPGFTDLKRKSSVHVEDQKATSIEPGKPRPTILKNPKDAAVAIGFPFHMTHDLEQSSFQQSYLGEHKSKSFQEENKLRLSTTSSMRGPALHSARDNAVIEPPTPSQAHRLGEGAAKGKSSHRIGHNGASIVRGLLKYKMIKLLQCLLAVYIGILTYADIGPPGGLRDAETGLIIDQTSNHRTEHGLILVNGSERPIAATTFFQVVCIGITRMSAFFMYPGTFRGARPGHS
jgi:hypothetical protein